MEMREQDSSQQSLNAPILDRELEFVPVFEFQQRLQCYQDSQLHQLQQQQSNIVQFRPTYSLPAHESTTAVAAAQELVHMSGQKDRRSPLTSSPQTNTTSPTLNTAKKTTIGACLSCRRRKVKCDNKKPCSQCVAHDRVYDCLYVQPRQRVYITQKYTRELEDRVHILEGLLKQHQPSIDLDSLNSSRSSPSAQSHLPTTDSPGKHLSISAGEPLRSETTWKTLPEDTPSQHDGYEWDEKQVFNEYDTLVDGMATLSSSVNNGSSYLGASSGAAAFRTARQISNRQGSSAVSDSESWQDSKMETSNSTSFQYTDAAIGSTRLPSVVGIGAKSIFLSHIDDDLVKSYFFYYHKSYPVIHEPTFIAQYKGVLPKPVDGSWPLILNMILAIGAWTSSTAPNDVDLHYYEQARRHLTADLFESGRLGTVQALTLMANYLQKRNKPNFGNIILGIAVRMALSLGMHREFPDWNVSPLQKEIRRRTWWTLFVLETGVSITLGRPMTFGEGSLSALNVRLPVNVHDEDFTVLSSTSTAPSNHPTPYSCLIAQATFAKVAVKIHSRLLAGRLSSYNEIQPFDDIIDRWVATLPPYLATDESPSDPEWLALPRGIIWWRVQDQRLQLYRQLFFNLLTQGKHVTATAKLGDLPESADYKSDKANAKVMKICHETARQTIKAIHSYYLAQSHNQGGTWYVVYFLMQAVFIPLASLLADPTDTHRQNSLGNMNAHDCREQINQVLWVFNEAKIIIPAVSRCIDAINSLLSPLDRVPKREKRATNVDDTSVLYMSDIDGSLSGSDTYSSYTGSHISRTSSAPINENQQIHYGQGSYDLLEQANFDFWLSQGVASNIARQPNMTTSTPFGVSHLPTGFMPQQPNNNAWDHDDQDNTMSQSESDWSRAYW